MSTQRIDSPRGPGPQGDSQGRPQAAVKVSSELLDRLPPQSVEAEKAVLGCILLDEQACDDVALVLKAEDFYAEAHRRLYEHLIQMHEDGRRIDPMLVVEKLNQAGELEQVGGVTYLTEIAQSVPSAAHAVYYAEIIRDKATLRSLIHTSTLILRDSYDPTASPEEMLSQAEEKVFAIRDRRDTSSVSSMQEVLEEALVRIDQRMQNEHALGGVEFGYQDMDNMTGGMHGSELLILAARPSMGKTAFALNIAENVAVHQQAATLFVSLEMSRYELADRMLCAIAEVNGHRLRNGTISNDERHMLIEKAAVMSSSPLFIDDTPSRSMTEIAATARRLKRSDNLQLIIIDYLQLVEPDRVQDPRQEQVAKIARRLKGLARELDVPVMCLAQLNRQTEQGRDGHRPKLSQLRESGAIEQDADVVMFVHREEYYESDPDARAAIAGQAEIIMAKQRNGPTGEVKLCWRHEIMRFEQRALEWQGDGGF